MKTVLAAALLATSLAWTGNKPGWNEEERSSASDFYRSLGRAEARWMGSLSGETRDFASLDAGAFFDWMRTQGRSEAHLTDGFIVTGKAVAAGQQGASESLQASREGCTLIDENRAKGRSEAWDSQGRYGRVFSGVASDSDDGIGSKFGMNRLACERL